MGSVITLVRTHAARLAAVGLFLVVLVAVAPESLALPVAADKDFAITGIVDCGQRSGQRCTIGDLLAVRTVDLSGVLERVVINVSWIRKQLEARRLDQDDAICI